MYDLHRKHYIHVSKVDCDINHMRSDFMVKSNKIFPTYHIDLTLKCIYMHVIYIVETYNKHIKHIN